MNIAVCDDERYELENISKLLNQYKGEKNTNITFELFENASELLSKIAGGVNYDVILLDVLMPVVNGIDVAQEIRLTNKTVKIAFLTSSPEYAVDSYSVKASGYILKPITENKLFSFLDGLFLDMEMEREKFLIIRTMDGLSRVLLSNLEYCEIYNKTIYVHMADKTVIESIGSMSQFEAELCPLPQFYKAHRSYIINLSFVSTVTTDMIIMQSGSKVPVPYRKANDIRNAALNYFDSTSLSRGGRN